MTSEKISVAIVTPVHNRRELTLLCLRSLERIDHTGLDIYTIVVDDGSSDGTAEAIRREFPSVELIAGNGDLWFTEGTNVGIRAALKKEVDYVLMINNDQVFDAGFLQAMIGTARTHPRSVVGPLLLLWDAPHKLFQTAPVWSTWLGGWRHWYAQTVWTVPDRPWEVELIVGNCVLVPSEAFRECGLMDAKHFPNFGDAEFTPRLKRNSWRLLIEPRARVFCQPNDLPPRVRNKSLRGLFHDLLFDLKNVHSLRRRWYAYVLGGPSKLRGAAAFGMFLLRTAAGRNVESVKYSQLHPEPPLREILKDSLVNQ